MAKTNPQILLSYTASDQVGILKFKVPNKVSTTLIDAVTMLDEKKPTLQVTLQTPLETTQPESHSQLSGYVTLKPAPKTLMPRKTSPDAAKSILPTTVPAHDILSH